MWDALFETGAVLRCIDDACCEKFNYYIYVYNTDDMMMADNNYRFELL